MKYFMYSPLEMSEGSAYLFAKPHLLDNHIVHVTINGVQMVPPSPGQRPSAAPGTYLVRVEQDHSLRIVQKAIT